MRERDRRIKTCRSGAARPSVQSMPKTTRRRGGTVGQSRRGRAGCEVVRVGVRTRRRQSRQEIAAASPTCRSSTTSIPLQAGPDALEAGVESCGEPRHIAQFEALLREGPRHEKRGIRSHRAQRRPLERTCSSARGGTPQAMVNQPSHINSRRPRLRTSWLPEGFGASSARSPHRCRGRLTTRTSA